MAVRNDTMTARVDEVNTQAIEEIREISFPLENSADLDPLMDLIGDAHCVLLGEASHGTHEYYLWRARISQRLIMEKGFNFISVEGDWPDCYRVNRYVKGYPDAGESAYNVLHAFERWPTWMWANWEIAALADWIRNYNQGRSNKVGFYGLDVYSLWESMEAILNYLEKKDPEAAQLARQAYRCFEPYGADVEKYAWRTRLVPENCETEVIDLLDQMQKKAIRYDGDPEADFNAEQNSLVLANAEAYYRAMVRSDQNSWNIRDTHMAETYTRLLDFHGPNSKGIVWAHNTHVGDARYTDMARDGMVNIGELARKQHRDEGVVLVGSSSYQGTVIAGREWGAEMQVLPVPPGQPGSWEALLHDIGLHDQLLILPPGRDSLNLERIRGQRAIGVVYNPEYEAFGNYVPTNLPQRYDAFFYVDQSQALHPMHIQPETRETPETYPWGL